LHFGCFSLLPIPPIDPKYYFEHSKYYIDKLVFIQSLEDYIVRNQSSYQQAELIDLAIRGIDAQIAELESKRAALLGQVGTRTVSAPAAQNAVTTSAAAPRKRSKFSAAHRAKLKAAAKLRWANARAKKAGAGKTTRASAQKSVRKAAK
jgi:hypothetical protein